MKCCGAGSMSFSATPDNRSTIVAGFLGAIAVYLFVPPKESEVLSVLVGALAAAFSMIVGHYFSEPRGHKLKETMDEIRREEDDGPPPRLDPLLSKSRRPGASPCLMPGLFIESGAGAALNQLACLHRCFHAPTALVGDLDDLVQHCSCRIPFYFGLGSCNHCHSASEFL